MGQKRGGQGEGGTCGRGNWEERGVGSGVTAPACRPLLVGRSRPPCILAIAGERELEQGDI